MGKTTSNKMIAKNVKQAIGFSDDVCYTVLVNDSNKGGAIIDDKTS